MFLICYPKINPKENFKNCPDLLDITCIMEESSILNYAVCSNKLPR